jgi:KDO2-lipid IV(A) lauroyltransferase
MSRMTVLRPFGYRLEAGVVRAALALLRRMDPAAASNLGGAVARAIGPKLPVSRVAMANLRLALPELDQAGRRRVLRGVWDNLGRTVAELPHVPALRQTAAGPGWEVAGADNLGPVLAHGGPAIFVSGHIGNWEMLPAAAAAYGVGFSSFYRAPANPFVDALLLHLRQQVVGPGVPQFAKSVIGARAAFAHLQAGGYLGVLVDQKLNEGIAVDLFGHKAMTTFVPAAFALRFRCPVIPGHVRRLGPARFRIVVEPPLLLPDSGDRRADVAALTRDINACLERWVRACPEGWLWLHRRWPMEVYR